MSIIFYKLRQSTIKQLENANSALRAGHNLKATHLYEQVLKKDLLKLFYDSDKDYGWTIDLDSEVSFHHAVILLSDYFSQTKSPAHWFRISAILIRHPDYQSLNINDRIRIDLINIQRNMARNIKVNETLERLLNYLSFDTLEPLIEGLIHYTIAIIGVVIRDEKMAFLHQRKANKLISADEEPYYYLMNYEHHATIYYMLNNNRRLYYEKAIQIYTETEEQARLLDMGHDFTYNGYNLGWIYAELELFEEAIHHFRRTITEAESTHNAIMVAKCEYGLGHVYSCLKDYDRSIEYLEDALFYFVDESYLYNAACLNLFAGSLLAMGNIEQAIIRLNYATDNLAKVDNPVQLHHVYRHYSIAYFMKKDFIKATKYFIKTYRLRLQYKMPLLPY
ncbi:MAG: hypothetical protein Phog2KO_26440 [Phototrophicaceae bacterium]